MRRKKNSNIFMLSFGEYLEVYKGITWGYFDNNYYGSYADAIYEEWEDYNGEIGYRCTIKELFDKEEVNVVEVFEMCILDNNPEWDGVKFMHRINKDNNIGDEECTVICVFDDYFDDVDGETIESKIAMVVMGDLNYV